MHVHFHIIPKYKENDGLGIRWDTQSLDKADATQLAIKISNELKA
jgi:diadenosine tetraphosphate (Ap4A) HIT family hydrolase